MRLKTKINPGLLTLDDVMKLSRDSINKAMKVADEATRKEYEKNFATEGANTGKKWAKNKPSTNRRKASKKLSNLILQATGAMKQAFVEVGGDHLLSFIRRSSTSVEINVGATGESGRKADTHKRGEGKLPVRDVARLKQTAKVRIAKKVGNILAKLIAKDIKDKL